VQINLTLTQLNGFAGTVNVSISGLPSGVTASPASPFTLPTSGLAVTLTAGSNVANGNYALAFDATSGSLSSSSSVSLVVEPLASFSLTLSSSNLIVRQGASVSGIFQVSLGSGSTNFSLSLSVQGLPSGVTATFTQNPLPATLGQPTLTLTATSTATIVQNAPAELVAARASDGATATANFTVTVAQPPGNLPGNRTNFIRTDDTPKSIVYDSGHNLVYAALPHLSTVDVINPATGAVEREIPVPDAQGLSLSPDGKEILVSGSPQQVAWISTGSEEVIGRQNVPLLQPSCTCSPEYFSPGQPMILANGNVLFDGSTPFFEGVVEWDPAAGQITQLSPSTTLPFGQGSFGVRSADGTKALFSSNTTPGVIGLFDSASNGFTATKTFNDIPFAMAANPNGTQFAVAVNNEATYLLDNQLNVLGTAPVGGVVTGMVYSPDGSYLYVVSLEGGFPLISTINTSTFQLVGQAPAYASNIAYVKRIPPLVVETPMAVDSTGLLFGAADHGVALDDSTDFQNLSLSAAEPVDAITASPAEGPQNASTPVTITTQTFSEIPDVWFGGLRGTNLSLSSIGLAQATAPPAPEIGPVNVKIISPDGTEGNIPEAFTYAAFPVNFATLAGPPAGGVYADIFGYGYSSDLGAGSAQVQIGGESAAIDASQLFPAEYSSGYPFPLDDLRVTVPPAAPGAADIRVSSTSGTATVPAGFHYVQSVTDYPSTDSFQFVLYDPKRQQLYLSAGAHIDVFSLSGNTFLAPITPPSLSGQGQIVWLALTPDDSELLAANAVDNSVAVINPDDPGSAKVVQIVPTGTGNGYTGPSAIAPTSTGIAFITTEDTNPESGTVLNLYQLDLATLQVSPVSISGNDLFVGGGLVLASRNGSAVMAYFGGDSGGPVYSWTAAGATWTLEHDTEGFITSAAVSGNGGVFVADEEGTPSQSSTIVKFLDPATNVLGQSGLPEYMSAVPLPIGMRINDSGSLAYVPVVTSTPVGTGASLEDAVDIYDVRNNRLRERVLLPEQFPSTAQSALAIDPTGKNVFLITKAGLTIVTLDSVPLSIASVTPSSGVAGMSVTIYGSGFAQGTTASFNGTSGSVTFVDADTLQATIPSSLASGAVSVTLTNPDGSTYTLDDAFTVD
jgi:hypothetical protein